MLQYPTYLHEPSITSSDLLNILINSPLLKQINHLKQLYKNCQITCQNKIFPFKIHKSKIKSSASIQLNHEFTLTESIKGLHWVGCHCLPSTSSGNFNIHRWIKTARRFRRQSEGIIYYLWIAPRAKHHQINFKIIPNHVSTFKSHLLSTMVTTQIKIFETFLTRPNSLPSTQTCRVE